MPQIDASFPDKLACLFQPKRHKVLYGGRGAGRSWGVARALLLIGTERAIRVLCVRELQNSISESVHKLLSDQITALGLDGFYEVQVGRIIGKNGTSFSFEGIKNNTSKIKSYEAIDYCWVEEGNKVSKNSWQILLPTVRKDGSEIWITFNPELDTDYTYKRFVLEPSEDSFVVKMTWRDNPWFPAVLKDEMEDLRKRDYDTYLNVWEGNTLQMLEGVVFAEQLRKAQAEGRICTVPWDPTVPVDTFWDLGRKDQTSIWFIQRVAMQWRALNYFENTGEDISFYLKALQGFPYTYGWDYIPHDGAAARVGEKKTIEQNMRGLGRKVIVVPRIKKKANAINAARMIFSQVYFDERNCAEGLDRLRHYRYKILEGQYSTEPLHDDNSNGADAFMTFAQGVREHRSTGNVVEKLLKQTSKFTGTVREANLRWMG